MTKRWTTAALATIVSCALVSGHGPEAEAQSPAARRKPLPDFDVRDSAPSALRAPLRSLGVQPGAVVRGSAIKHGGYLTEPSSESPEAIARAFLAGHPDVFPLDADDFAGLVVSALATTPETGVTQLVLAQTDRGRRVEEAGVTLAIDREGRILMASGPTWPGAGTEETPAFGAEEAVAAALQELDLPADAPLEPLPPKLGGPGANALRFRNTVAIGVKDPSDISAELVTFPMPGEASRIAWKLVVEADPAGWYQSIVDARTGQLLARRNLYRESGPQGKVFTAQHPGVSATRSVVGFGGDAAFDNAGWVTDRRTSGNNTNTYQDANGTNSSSCQPETPASGDANYQHFDYAFTNAWATSSGVDFTTDCNAVVTQLFYLTNLVHDHFYRRGFTEPFRNFQIDNFGRGGSGSDPVLAEADDDVANATCCNANFGTPADGSSPRMQMFVGMPPNNNLIQRANNGDTVFHEYSHGLSNRLVGGGSLGGGAQTNGMGEGWGDFMATSYWNDPVYGEYNNGNATTGIRGVAYNNSSLVYTDLCSGGCEEHDDGEIWATVLWDMRTALVARYGLDPGRERAEFLVVDGMKNIGTNPTFLTARDGILAADVTRYASANQCLIWGAFAGREMGFSAASATQSSVTAGTDGPASCTPVANAGGPYVTPEGTNALLSAAASTLNGDPPFTYEWDLDNDGQYDDATGASPAFTTVGQDGVFPIGLRLTNANGFSSTASSTVTVTNVAPSIALASDAPRPENSAVTVTGTISDPGWLDPLSATIDWDGAGPEPAAPLAGVLENARPDATFSFAASHVYGDDGVFPVTVCGFDDDTATCAVLPVTVTNVPPTATIDEGGTVLVNGVPTIITNAGANVPFKGRSTDPGSDDLLLSWDWADGPPSPDVTTKYLNDPLFDPDPDPSPTIHPRDVTDSKDHAFGQACLYDVGFRAVDDDAGATTDNVKVLVTGNSTQRFSAGYWLQQYSRSAHIPSATLDCYLKIVDYVSNVFGPLTRAQAAEILKPGGGTTALEQFDRQLLAALSNFANGTPDYNTLIDTDGNGTGDTPFLAFITAAEAARLNPATPKSVIVALKDVLEKINLGS
jgi:hypothetical protein